MLALDQTPTTLHAAIRYFDLETARKYVESIKWPNGPACPKCGSANVGRIASRDRHQCREKGCRKQFSLITGTIMEASHLRVDQWLVAAWMIANCRNGVSSCEIARAIGCKQQSAWHLLHRVRHLMQQDFAVKFGRQYGVVEADSTFVGGALKFMSYDRQERARKRHNYGKAEVHAIKDRQTGHVRARILDCPPKDFILGNVRPAARLYTDEGKDFKFARGSDLRHRTVNHSKLEWGRGSVHVNGLENYFNCLRRALKGTYIATSPEHLQAYVDEQTYRFNMRGFSEWNRFDTVMHLIVGKRLTYSELTDGAKR